MKIPLKLFETNLYTSFAVVVVLLVFAVVLITK